MKKTILSLLFIGSAATFSLTSCDELKDKVKDLMPAFTHSSKVTITLPDSIPSGSAGEIEQMSDFNINEILQEGAGDGHSLDDVNSIMLKTVTLHLVDSTADEQNNWTNFANASMSMNTEKGKSGGKPALSQSVTIADTEAEKLTDKVLTFAENNLKDYVDAGATKAIYSFTATARRDVSKPLTIIATIEYSFKPNANVE